jgi:hypothetical protein
MLKQFAPKAVIPPSPKTRHWIRSATDVVTTAAQGPRIIATSALPTACPELPPGTGTLNIMITNENAAASARYGTCRDRRFFWTQYPAYSQIGIIIRYMTIKVVGPKYPSGICITTPD